MKDNKKKKIDIRKGVMIICVTILLLSTATFAWFSESNTPKMNNLALMAGASGSLLIADDTGNGPGKYDETLDLSLATGANLMDDAILNPVTTKDGISFYSPLYTGNAVTGVKQITDEQKLSSRYVYEKSFYLKAGPNPKNGGGVITTEGKLYNVYLAGRAGTSQTEGTYVTAAPDVNGGTNDTAANSMRISFELEDGTMVILEPNADASNADTKRAEDGVKNQYGTYTTLQQSKDGHFIGAANSYESPVLFTIKEGQDVKVTMKVWIEGTDVDCTNSIVLDEIMARFQFMSADVVN